MITGLIGSFVRPNLDELSVLHALLGGRAPGVMVDVGAHFGSSLRRFADEGWRVLALEPDGANRAELERRTAHFSNVTVDARAVSARDGDLVDLYTSDVSTGISSLAPFHPSHRRTETVETVRLDTLLATVPEVTVLKTDTEGFDLPVLRTFPWDRIRPRGVVAEFEDRKTIPLGYDFRDLAEFLELQGYAVFVSEWFPVVEYGQHHRWRSIRRYPTMLHDPGAWGNVLAIDPPYADEIMKQARWGPRFRALWTRAIRRVTR